MKAIRWALCGSAVFALCAVAMVRAQDDDPFGIPNSAQGVNPEADTTPHPRTPLDDLFGAPAANPQSNKKSVGPTPTAETDLFGPATPAPAPAPVPSGPTQQTIHRILGVANENLCKCEGDTNLAAIARIETALSSPLSRSGLEFADAPLEEVVNVIQDEYRIPIQIDVAALDKNGIGSDEPVSTNLQGISLRSALRLLLKPLQLVYVIDHEVLVVTTRDDADSRIKVCVYDVRDLIDAPAAVALSELTNVITASISPDSWAESSGKGSIRSYPPNLLVIAQPQGVHEQVQDLLKRMRQMRQRPDTTGKPLPASVPTR